MQYGAGRGTYGRLVYDWRNARGEVMNGEDKVTLEWLTRVIGTEPPNVNGPNGFFAYINGATLAVDAYSGGGCSSIEIYKDGGDDATILEPTIARFYEALAFLGASLPPLRTGEAKG